MKADLIKKIREQKDLQNVIVLTHNVDCVFLESVLLPTLRRVGNPALTVFAEERCAFEMYNSNRPYLSRLGRQYRLVPVSLPHPFRFHPKAVLLSSTAHASLFVGSGNVGFGGWRENGEIWAEFELDEEDQSEARAFAFFRDYLSQILMHVPLSETVSHDVLSAFDPEQKKWITYLREAGGLAGKVGLGKSLIDQLPADFTQGETEKLWVCTPYFDDKAEALQVLKERFSAHSVVVLLQENETTLTREAAENLQEDFDLKSVTFLSPDKKPRFLHAKFYAIERNNRVQVILGSANCSQAAWMIPGTNGNAELVAFKEMGKQAFEKIFLKPMKILEQQPRLRPRQDQGESSELVQFSLKVLAARLKGSTVQVGFHKSEGVEIKACSINNRVVEYHLNGSDTLTAVPLSVSGHQNLSLRLEGKSPAGKIVSNDIWIDLERELGASSKERTLADTINQKIRRDTWNLPVFNEVLNLLLEHMEHLSPHGRLSGGHAEQKPQEEAATIRFTKADVFSESFGALSKSSLSSESHLGDATDGLRRLLLEYFNLEWIVDDPDDYVRDSLDVGEDEEELHHGEHRLTEKRKEIPEEEINEKDRQKMHDLLGTLIQKMSDKDFLSFRAPELLAKDLSIVAVLMAAATKKSWLQDDEYFDFTKKIWTGAFFRGGTSPTESVQKGFLEHLYLESETPDHFAENLASLELAAALAAWGLTAWKPHPSPDEVEFTIVQVAAVAHLPWLWRVDSEGKLRSQVRRFLINTGYLAEDDERSWKKYWYRWRELIRVGYAVREFKIALENAPEPPKFKDLIQVVDVHKGELLWQGSAGLCIAKKDSKRNARGNVHTVSLQGPYFDKVFGASFLIPVSALMATEPGQQVKERLEVPLHVLSDFLKFIVEPLSKIPDRK